MTKLSVGVVGCGHLGRIHAKLLSQIDSVELTGVFDPRQAAREDVARQVGTTPYSDMQELASQVKAVVVAAPTFLHTELGLDLIGRGLHVLMEKPLAPTLAEAEQLAEAARRAGTVLAIGHVERFNPAFQLAAARVEQPSYIEAIRTGPFSFRSMDVGVVMDLMVHDLELVLSLVNSPIVSVTAVGASVVTSHEDWAEAHVSFASGCVARFFASRVSPKAQRQLSLFGTNIHAIADLGDRKVQWIERCSELQQGTWQVEQWSPAQMESFQNAIFEKMLPLSTPAVPAANPLQDELVDFVDSILRHRLPRVTAKQAVRTVALAEEILHQTHTRSTHRSLTNIPQRRAA